MKIQPVGEMVAIEFLEDEDETEAPEYGDTGTPQPDNDAEFALCVGVGKELKVCKVGDVVLVDRWARNGLTVPGSNAVIVDKWAIRAVVKDK